MSLENDNQFDDPALKAALARACGGEKAPAALADRVRTMLAHSDRTSRLRIARANLPRPWWRELVNLAAAAIILLGLAGGMYRLLFYQGQPATAMMPELVSAMVSTHDAWCNGQAKGQNISGTVGDLQAMGQAMGRTLGHPVLMADLSDDGWKFDGASFCKVGNRKAAHLMFRRGAQTISVFSFASDCPMNDCECCQNMNGHAVAGFTRGGMVYCMVGVCPKGTLSSEELEGLLARHKDALVAPASLGGR